MRNFLLSIAIATLSFALAFSAWGMGAWNRLPFVGELGRIDLLRMAVSLLLGGIFFLASSAAKGKNAIIAKMFVLLIMGATLILLNSPNLLSKLLELT